MKRNLLPPKNKGLSGGGEGEGGRAGSAGLNAKRRQVLPGPWWLLLHVTRTEQLKAPAFLQDREGDGFVNQKVNMVCIAVHFNALFYGTFLQTLLSIYLEVHFMEKCFHMLR